MKWRPSKTKDSWKAKGFEIRAVPLTPIQLIYHVYYNKNYVAYCVTLTAAKAFCEKHLKTETK